MSAAVEVRVTGEVQGVNFRSACGQEADQRGVAGWARNEDDGSVRAHFEGDDDAVQAMVDWCRRGPSQADVNDVQVETVAAENLTGFETG